MPETPTTRLGLHKPLNDGSENVNVQTDLNQNWDKVDGAAGFQAVTSSTRPSSPYSGKGVMETDTAYRTYFSNGSVPASASWIQIPNSNSTFNADLDLTSGKQLNIGGSTSAASLAVVNTTAGSDLLTGRVTGDTQSRFILDTDGSLNWGPGGSTPADTFLARTATGRLALTGTGAALVIGSATYQNALTATAVTLANSTTETAVGTFTIPANDAVAGATYRARVVTNVSFLASAQLTWRARLGGVGGTVLATAGPTTLSGTGQTNKESIVEVDLVCVSTGAAGTWFSMLKEARNTTQAGSLGDLQLGSTDGTITRDTTAANAFVITAQWAAASASNTLTARVVFERVA